LKKCLKRRALLEALKDLPKTLDDTYTRILRSIDDEYQQEAITALRWLVSSERPLRIDELAEATAVDPHSDPAFDPKERLRDPYCVLQILTSLVTISPKIDTHDSSQMIIELAHFSVKEYLLSGRTRSCLASKFHISNIVANEFIAKSSLLYILSYSDSKASSSSDLESFPLLRYACQFWYTHVKSIPMESQESINPIIFRLYLSNTALAAWLQVHRPDIPNGEPFKFPKNAGSPLYYASDTGLEAVVRLLLKHKADVNSKTESGGTALHRAAWNGHEEVVRLLLEHKADVNAKNNGGETALHQAAEKGHEAIVWLLLENKADVKAKADYQETALHRAAGKGHETVAQLLLEHKAEVDAKDGYRATALHQAAGSGDKAVVWLLLEHKADVDAKDKSGWTALHLATKNRREAVVQLLLEHNADVNAKNNSGRTALHWAVENGHEAVVRLLLEHNADVKAKASFGGLALHHAAGSGHEAVVRLLLEHKADVDLKNNGGETALHWAAENGHEAVVRLLLEHNANIDEKDGFWGWTALRRAAKNNHETVVRLLLEHKADADANDKSGGTALHQAAEKRHQAVGRLDLDPTQKTRAEEWIISKSTRYPANYGHLNDPILKSLVEEAQPHDLNYSLASKLRRARFHYVGFEYFIPLSDINRLITASIVEQEILKADPNTGARACIYAHRVENSAKKLFAILALLQNCAAICSLLDSNFSDQDLPFRAKKVDHHLSLWRREPKERIKELDNWVDKDVEEFSRVQWWMTAPVFDKESLECLELADEIVMPFIPLKEHEVENSEIPQMKIGGYGEVTAYRIHPAHHNFWVWDTSLLIVRNPS
jgi:ankyrin repeat protein